MDKGKMEEVLDAFGFGPDTRNYFRKANERPKFYESPEAEFEALVGALNDMAYLPDGITLHPNFAK